MVRNHRARFQQHHKSIIKIPRLGYKACSSARLNFKRSIGRAINAGSLYLLGVAKRRPQFVLGDDWLEDFQRSGPETRRTRARILPAQLLATNDMT